MKCSICKKIVKKPAYSNKKILCQACWEEKKMKERSFRKIGKFWAKWIKE